MDGLMMDYQLTVPAIVRRCASLFGAREVISRLPDRSLHRTTYGAVVERARRLAVALAELGVRPGDRVATMCWNHHVHLEAYLGIPSLGAVVHTLNPRLPADDLAFVVEHAGDRVLLVDHCLLGVLETFRDRVELERVVVVGDGELAAEGLRYEALLAAADPAQYREPDLDERQAAATCYTSGTTGRPKGVLYSHRALVLHTLVSVAAEVFGVHESDAVMPVVPMFHANAWGLPFSAALTGAKLVLPGPHLDPASLLELLEGEAVTVAAGVPTVWIPVLQALDEAPGGRDLSALRLLIIGGSAAPPALIEGFGERHGVWVMHAWGMTELSPVGTVANLPHALASGSPEARYAARAKQGRPIPFVEVRARGESGLVPFDGRTMGELEVRGPAVASAYVQGSGDEQFTDDGWFRTGDVVTIDAGGAVHVQDRAKDLVKSGGEWISSVALENALMGNPAVAEAAVIAVPDPHWHERPLAVVVLREGAVTSEPELRAQLAARFPKWWLPDRFEFVDAIPRTATGKFLKSALRERFGAAPAPPRSEAIGAG